MIQIGGGRERRKDPRLSGSLPVKIRSDSFDIVTDTKNLSRSGVYCQCTQMIEPMTKLKIQLLLSFKRDGKIVNKKVSCQGVVVRAEKVSDDCFNVAIYFSDIQTKDADCIMEYVNSALDVGENN